MQILHYRTKLVFLFLRNERPQNTWKVLCTHTSVTCHEHGTVLINGEIAAGKAYACKSDLMLCMRRQTRMAAGAGLSAGVRLMRLELLATRQAQALLAAERQITKLNTRARLLGKDLQPPLRQVSNFTLSMSSLARCPSHSRLPVMS